MPTGVRPPGPADRLDTPIPVEQSGFGQDGLVATIPDSTKTSLRQRLADRATQRWPALAEVQVRYRAGFAYIDGVLPDGQVLHLCRLRYGGSANHWGFAIYRASHDDYDDSYLPTGTTAGSAENALDTACGLYLGDPTAWT
jgi:hypothetical protein